MAKKYKMVRLTEETHDQLQAVRAAMQLANIDMRSEHAESELFGVTMETAVRSLVLEYWRHRKANHSRSLQEVREALEKVMATDGLAKLYNGTRGS